MPPVIGRRFFKSSQMNNNNITVGQYQQFYNINKQKEVYELDRLTQTIAVLSNRPHDEIEEMAVEDFKVLASEAENILQRASVPGKPPRYINVDGKLFSIIYNPRKLKAWQFMKVQDLMKGNVIESLHQLIAVIVKPVKDYKLFKIGQQAKPNDFEHTAELMRHASFNDINSACQYFITLWNNSIKALQPVIESDLLKQATIPMQKDEAELIASSAILSAQIKQHG